MLHQCALYKAADGLSFLPSAVVSSDFCPRLRENRVIFNVLSVSMVRLWPSEVMIQASLALVPISAGPCPLLVPSHTHQSLCSPRSAIFLPAAEWWPRWAQEVCGRPGRVRCREHGEGSSFCLVLWNTLLDSPSCLVHQFGMACFFLSLSGLYSSSKAGVYPQGRTQCLAYCRAIRAYCKYVN